MQSTLILILAMLLSMTAAAEKGDSINKTGQFEYTFSTVEVSPIPGRSRNTGIQATAGFEIRNTGSVPVRVAVVTPWPTLQIEGGIHFVIRYRGITGIAFDDISIQDCSKAAVSFSLIRPDNSLTASLFFDSNLGGRELLPASWGRISGQLLVQSTDDKTCWIEPFTVGRVSVSVVR
mgnify:CR=1 FL=1